MNKLGQRGEDLVCERYLRAGHKLLARNFVSRSNRQTGELDLVFEGAGEIIFVEVKARSSLRFGTPFEAVDRGKQQRLVRAAKSFMQRHAKYQDWNFRIDVAAVDIDNSAEPVIILTNAIEDFD